MPLFDVKCEECEKVSEVLVKVGEDLSKLKCPCCDAEGKLVKQLSAPSVQLNGTGWYKDGYR